MSWRAKEIRNLSKFMDQQHFFDLSAMLGSLECLLDFLRVPIPKTRWSWIGFTSPLPHLRIHVTLPILAPFRARKKESAWQSR